jgi:hypothetical protein
MVSAIAAGRLGTIEKSRTAYGTSSVATYYWKWMRLNIAEIYG